MIVAYAVYGMHAMYDMHAVHGMLLRIGLVYQQEVLQDVPHRHD